MPGCLTASMSGLAVALLLCGCSSSNPELAAKRETGSAAVAKGEAAFANRDYAAAAESLSAAVNDGVLNPDVYSSAAVKLVVCYAATGKFDEANALLAKLDAGAPNLDQVNAARAYVLAKQGKAAESRAALAKARQYNPTVQEFKD